MNSILINQIAVGALLLITALVGVRVKRSKSVQDYILANRSLGTGVLAMTLIATWLEAGDIVGIKVGFYKGLISLFSPFCLCIITILLGYLVFPKMRSGFDNCHTGSQVMGEMYGSTARILTVVSSTIFSMGIIIGQLAAFGELVSLLGISKNWLIIGMGLLITCYTLVKGMRAVAITDVLQLVFLLVGTVVFMMACLSQFGGLIKLFSDMPEGTDHFSFWEHPDLKGRLLATFFWAICPTLFISPPIIQRVLMAKKPSTVKHMFLSLSITFLFLRVALFLIGLVFYKYQESIEVDFSLGSIIGNCHSQIAQVLFLLAVVAIIMSTMDSFIFALATMWATDIIQPFLASRNITSNPILMSRALIFLTGLLSIAVGILSISDANDISAYGVIALSPLCVPLIAGVVGLKPSRKAFLSSLFCFIGGLFLLMMVGFSDMVDPNNHYHNNDFYDHIIYTIRITWFFVIILSAIVFFMVNYLENGKFVIIDREKDLWKITSTYRITVDLSWFFTPFQWADKKVFQYGKRPYVVGVFIYLSYMVPYITFDSGTQLVLFLAIVRGIGGILCTLLLLESIWPKKLRPYFNGYYMWTIFYCVPFVGLMTSFADSKGLFTTMNVILAIILLTGLVDWRTFCLFEMLSLIAVLFIHKVWKGCFIPDFGLHGIFLLSISVVYTLITCMIFFAQKEKETERKLYKLTISNEDTVQELQIQREAHTQLANSLDPQSVMISELTNVIERQKQGAFVKDDVYKLENIVKFFAEIKTQSMEYLPLKPKKGTLKGLMQAVMQELKATGWAEKVELKINKKSIEGTITADILYIQQLVINSLKYQYKQYGVTQVYCDIDATTISYNTENHNKQTNAYRFTITSQPTKLTQKTYDLSQAPPDIAQDKNYLLGNHRIITSHLGLMEVIEKDNLCLLTYVLPCDVNEVKPKNGAFSDEDLQNITQIEDPADVAFLKLADKKGMNHTMMERALRTCKHAHRGVSRNSGEPFYLHPVAVTSMLLEHTTDQDTIIAGLLHDTLEDTAYNLYKMNAEYGEEVTQIVKDVTNLYNHKSRKVKLAKQKVFEELLDKKSNKALLVKLLDRVHNIQTIGGHSDIAKRKKVANETIKFFVPVAQKLGKKKIEAMFVKQCKEILALD